MRPVRKTYRLEWAAELRLVGQPGALWIGLPRHAGADHGVNTRGDGGGIGIELVFQRGAGRTTGGCEAHTRNLETPRSALSYASDDLRASSAIEPSVIHHQQLAGPLDRCRYGVRIQGGEPDGVDPLPADPLAT